MCLVLVTAMGLLAAMTLASSRAESATLAIAHCIKLTDDLLTATLDHIADETNLLSLLSTKDTTGKSQLTSNRTVAHNLGEALQGADVSSKADLDLLESMSA